MRRPLFAPQPVDYATQGFFALLAGVVLVTVSNGFITSLVATPPEPLVRAAILTLSMLA